MSTPEIIPWPDDPSRGWEQCDYNEWHEARFQSAMSRLLIAVDALKDSDHRPHATSCGFHVKGMKPCNCGKWAANKALRTIGELPGEKT